MTDQQLAKPEFRFGRLCPKCKIAFDTTPVLPDNHASLHSSPRSEDPGTPRFNLLEECDAPLVWYRHAFARTLFAGVKLLSFVLALSASAFPQTQLPISYVPP